jgi:hypothetical protein
MLSCRLRPEEEAAIRAAAKAARKPLAVWMREVLLRFAAQAATGRGRQPQGQEGAPHMGDAQPKPPKS